MSRIETIRLMTFSFLSQSFGRSKLLYIRKTKNMQLQKKEIKLSEQLHRF